MWQTAAQDAKDPVRVAYCQTRIAQINNRIALVCHLHRRHSYKFVLLLVTVRRHPYLTFNIMCV